ncbi:MAG: cell division protein ZapA, partial [Proteobacteria bacterium]
MNLDDGVEVFSILGNEYSVKAPPGEQQALRQA